MSIKHKINILYLLILFIQGGFCFSSCTFNEAKWNQTQNGFKYFSQQKSDTIKYVWYGGHIDSVANGEGVLIALNKDGVELSRETIVANYGALNVGDVQHLSESEIYVGERSGNHMDGFGCYVNDGGDVYIGQFAKSKPHGKLNLYKDGLLFFSGTWTEGEYDGSGVLYIADEVPIKGVWSLGKLIEGNVTVDTEAGKYCGNVEKDSPNGYGVLYFKNGDIYEGNWKDGSRHGEGAFLSDTDTIVGIWEDGRLYGDVQYKSPEFYYEGTWIDNSPTGFGLIVFSEESYYNGGWIDGKKEGFGDFIFSPTSSYTGEWSNDSISGFGTLIYESEILYTGNWINGLQNGYGKFSSPALVYEGEWKEGWMQGNGRINYSNGDVYEGDMFENQKGGDGVYFFENGNTYEGDFVEDTFNGLGRFNFISGSVYEGEFRDGKIKGQGTLYLNTDNEKISITGVWDGRGGLPSEGSVAFENGDIYEGPLKNGFPTKEGFWSSKEERRKNETFASKANEFYKRHEDKWDEIVAKTQTTLAIVEVSALVLSKVVVSIPVPGVRSVAAGLAVLGATARITSYGVAAADVAVKASSSAFDASSRELDNETLKKRGKSVLLNDLVMLGFGKASSKIASKIVTPKNTKLAASAFTGFKYAAISGSALTVRKIGKVLPSFGKTGKPFNKVLTVARDKKGKIVKKILKSDVGITIQRMGVRPEHQFTSQKNFLKRISSNPLIKQRLGRKEGNSTDLAYNISLFLSEKAKRMMAKERLLFGKTADAHHIIAGNVNSKAARECRKILDKFGIDINDARNGILLPTRKNSLYKGSVHRMHTANYDKEVLRRLKQAKSQEDVLQIMDKLKRDIYDGKLALLSEKKHFANTTFSILKK